MGERNASSPPGGSLTRQRSKGVKQCGRGERGGEGGEGSIEPAWGVIDPAAIKRCVGKGGSWWGMAS